MFIRAMHSDDEKPVKRLVMKYLKETYDAGGDFPPTLENAAGFTQYAIEGAEAGDPCLVADEGGKIIGFVTARGVFFPGMTTRHKTVRSWGTFVLPEWRSKGIAVQLFIVAGRVARLAGYTRFLGMTHGSEYEAHALGVVDRIPGMQEVGKVLMMDLTRKARSAPAPEAKRLDEPVAIV